MFDLIMEGFRYTWRDKRLKMLFLLETFISFFALFYLAQMPIDPHAEVGGINLGSDVLHGI